MSKISLPPDYVSKTLPYAHQLEAWEISRDRTAYALLMEMGTGKSKVVVDTGVYLHGKGAINGILIVAPNGVHRNWLINEFPAHFPDHIEHVAAYWTPNPRKAEKEAMAQLSAADSHVLRIFAMNVEAFSTQKGKAVAKRFVTLFDTLMAVDESSDICNPDAKRTKAVIDVGKHAKYRRILNGTPITRGPLDAFAQFFFLDPHIFGYWSYYAFRNHFAEWEKKPRYDIVKGKRVKRFYQSLVSYKNTDELSDTLRKHSYRALKADCLDLPEKIYERRIIQLTQEQKRMYKKAREEVVIAIMEDKLKGKILNELAVTKLLRLQQVLGGYMTVEELGSGSRKTVEINPPDKNPRMIAVDRICEEAVGKVIIWARFIGELEALIATLRNKYGHASTVGYYGALDDDEKVNSIQQFQENPDVRFFVGQVQSGIGFTLTAGSTVVYYSNTFSLRERLQSEDRAHRIGQKNNVLYIDIEALGTIDTKIIDTLRDRKEVADEIVDGDIKEWI
jgi:SNF2 family DNA or RNA helicase